MGETNAPRSDWRSLSDLSPDRIRNTRRQAQYLWPHRFDLAVLDELDADTVLQVRTSADDTPARRRARARAFVDAAVRGSRRMLSAEPEPEPEAVGEGGEGS